MSYQRSRGTAGYADSGNWTWEHYPPPFDGWGPPNPAPQPSPVLGGGGLGCSSCGGGCNDPMSQGMGQIDFSTWGWQQYGLAALGAYLLISAWEDVTSDTVRKGYRKGRKAAGSAASGVGSVIKYALVAGAAYGTYYFYNQYQTGGLAGFGDYQPQGFATPQILMAPTSNRSSQLQVPLGY